MARAKRRKRKRKKGTAYHPKSKSKDWNTNEHDCGLVRAAYGGGETPITTDPCSNPTSLVSAQIEYTKDDDGLAHPWWGRVFVNPPYGHEILLWFLKGIAEFRSGRAKEVIFLVPERIDTRWWHGIVLQARSICMTRGRRIFIGSADYPAPFPVAFIYFGTEAGRRRFERAFADEGEFWRPTHAQRLKARGIELTLPYMSENDEIPSDPEARKGIAMTQLLLSQFAYSFYESIKDLTIAEVVDKVGASLPAFMEGQETGLAAVMSGAGGLVPASRRRKTNKKKTKQKKPLTAKAKSAPKKKKAPKKAPKKKAAAPKAKAKGKGPTEGTQQLDDKVLGLVNGIAAKKGEVKIKDLQPKLKSFSDQQIRRSLVRLTKDKKIRKEGATKNTVYKAAA